MFLPDDLLKTVPTVHKWPRRSKGPLVSGSWVLDSPQHGVYLEREAPDKDVSEGRWEESFRRRQKEKAFSDFSVNHLEEREIFVRTRR